MMRYKQTSSHSLYQDFDLKRTFVQYRNELFEVPLRLTGNIPKVYIKKYDLWIEIQWLKLINALKGDGMVIA